MKYRRLKKGEIILPNDEIQEDNETWTKTTCSGQQSPDPQYTCHRQYRRKNSMVTIEWVDFLWGEIAKINQMDFDKIVWVEKGKPLDISDKIKRDFQFTGLSNKCFVTSRFWEAKIIK